MPVAGAEVERREVVAADVARARRERREFLVGDRRDARVVPVLVLRRGEAERGEAVERGTPKCAHGRGNGLFAAGDDVECRRVRVSHHDGRAHDAAAPASSLTQS